MYYSKGATTNKISVPTNYSGNTFRVIDESNRTYAQVENSTKIEEITDKNTSKISKNEAKNNNFKSKFNDFTLENSSAEHSYDAPSEVSLISSLLQGISVEDILLIGLMLVIHEENPNDNTLLLLLILLLVK